MERIKLVVIGAGSSYTPELIDGIVRHYVDLPVGRLVLVDVEMGLAKMEAVAGLVQRMLARAGLHTPVECTLDRRRALADADFVVTQFRVGGLAARSQDEKIPLRHGLIGQETTGPGGFAKALRTIPVVREIAADLKDAAPGAWVINFTNPSGIITETFRRCGHERTVGLCNVPLSMQRAIARGLGVAPERVRLEMIGLNHLSWARRIWLDNREITAQVLSSPLVSREVISNIPPGQVEPDFLSSIGMLPSPYLKYYYFPRHVLAEQQRALAEGRGTRADEVTEVERRLFERYRDPQLAEKPPELSQRGGAWYSEAAVSVMRAIFCNRPEVHVVNTLNACALSDLPEDAVVETNCLIDGAGAHPICSGSLPESVSGLVQHVKNYERLTIKAGWDGDPRLAVQALATHPLVADASVAAALWNDLLQANLQYLPQFTVKRVPNIEVLHGR